MSNCFYSGNPMTMEELLEENPSLKRYYQGLPEDVQRVLQAYKEVIQYPAALSCYASKLQKDQHTGELRGI